MVVVENPGADEVDCRFRVGAKGTLDMTCCVILAVQLMLLAALLFIVILKNGRR